MVATTGIRPRTELLGFDDIPAGFERLLSGDILGKLVVEFGS
jgi:NADPH-dependent curcumin reductase CurA